MQNADARMLNKNMDADANANTDEDVETNADTNSDIYLVMRGFRYI
jgi:hypothetical protein